MTRNAQTPEVVHGTARVTLLAQLAATLVRTTGESIPTTVNAAEGILREVERRYAYAEAANDPEFVREVAETTQAFDSTTADGLTGAAQEAYAGLFRAEARRMRTDDEQGLSLIEDVDAEEAFERWEQGEDRRDVEFDAELAELEASEPGKFTSNDVILLRNVAEDLRDEGLHRRAKALEALADRLTATLGFGELLITGAREALAIERGEMEPAKVTRYPLPWDA